MMTTSVTDNNGGTTGSLDDALTALRAHFRASSGPIVNTFERLATQLSAVPTSPRALETLKRELHRVKGTAGSYGFLDASALATRLEDRATAWSKDSQLDLDSRATIISHFGSALHLAFQRPVAADQLPALTAAPRRRMLLVGVSEVTRGALADEATKRGYVLESIDAARWSSGAARDQVPHLVVMPRDRASRVSQSQSVRWLPTLEIDDGGNNASEAGALLDRADRLLLATTWLRPTILVLDDDPSILAIARYALGQELRVVTIETPVQVLETLEREQPVVLLFEARLPSFDAIAFTRMLRAMAAYRDLPILLLGANLDSGARLAAYDAGVDETLTKPLIPLELRARVAQLLERLRVERLTSGVHAMTAIALPARAHEAVDEHRALATAGRRVTSVLVTPRVSGADPTQTVAWLRESRRLARAIGATARFAAYRDDLSLLLILDAPSALAARLLESLHLNKPGEAPEWDTVVDEGRGPESLLTR
jgi:DNA-binding response OmpR family regulator/HPt (histidine-containing phosphotransfer) domain-containing protein